MPFRSSCALSAPMGPTNGIFALDRAPMGVLRAIALFSRHKPSPMKFMVRAATRCGSERCFNRSKRDVGVSHVECGP
ncbi:hypothetical protein Bra471DRAFT_02012 [Bradyrhizobium sp. WSM471]|nr:hypothetical protein Bra471DRAFT_02012 [Bradyrhizobium sp. WSM471]